MNMMGHPFKELPTTGTEKTIIVENHWTSIESCIEALQKDKEMKSMSIPGRINSLNIGKTMHVKSKEFLTIIQIGWGRGFFTWGTFKENSLISPFNF